MSIVLLMQQTKDVMSLIIEPVLLFKYYCNYYYEQLVGLCPPKERFCIVSEKCFMD